MRAVGKKLKNLSVVSTVASLVFASNSLFASSHMDAPLITLDDAANTTDVYAFVSSSNGQKYLTTALAVYPFEEPGIGPNKYNFDDNVRYEIHVALGNDVNRGKATVSYQFKFRTEFKNENTILQSYLGVINNVDDGNQNLTQTYTVRQVDQRTGRRKRLGRGIVPPNNQGSATPKYNQGDNGENPAKEGVSNEAGLDDYTRQSIAELKHGHRAFAGQRDDGFYADIQGVFDLLRLESPVLGLTSPNKPFDSQGGFNVHTIVLQIPVEELGGDMQVVGVYATTSRREEIELSDDFEEKGDEFEGPFIQVARQGNPLFNEGFVAIKDKDLYSRSRPKIDDRVFRTYAENPELGALLNGIHGTSIDATGRADLAAIFIPDLIKVDLSTGPARLAGNPDDEGFSRLSVFGGDVLVSQIQPGFFGNGTLPGGWPNGRRFGDDVLDIAVCALLSDLSDPNAPILACDASVDVDAVTVNDITYNKVMPYAATPLNGRSHGHH